MPRLRRTPHLEYRKSGYVWRRRFPRSLTRNQHTAEPTDSAGESTQLWFQTSRVSRPQKPENAGGQKERKSSNPLFLEIQTPVVLFSLKTHNFVEALELATRLTALSNLTFHYISSNMTLTPTLVRDILTTLARFEIEATDRIRALDKQRTPEAAEFALRRERAQQDTLRQALSLRNREVARKPLSNVARHLGIDLPQDGDDWMQLAYEATRVLLNLSEERERRELGLFSAPSPYFAQAVGPHSQVGFGYSTMPTTAFPAALDLTITDWHTNGAALSVATTVDDHCIGNHHQPVASPKPRSSNAAEQPNELPASPQVFNDQPTDPLKTVGERVILKNCKPETLKALRQGSAITIREAFDVYVDLKLQGYGEEWDKLQKPDKATGENWKKSTLPGINVAKTIWIDLLNNCVVDKIQEVDVLDHISVIRDIPTLHGKSPKMLAENGYRALVSKVNSMERVAMEIAERDLEKSGVTDPVEIEMARLDLMVARLRAETFFKHVRTINRVGKMLLSFGLILKNPFVGCTFTKREEKMIKKTEAKIARQRWDDRQDLLLETPVFQGQTKGVSDPLFWVPIIGFTMGLRSEECLQLKPEDFGSEKGVAYVLIRNIEGNSVKSEAGERKLPIHPALIELGLLDLVDSQASKGRRRLFADLRRGKTKGTYSENFTKDFTRYRQAHNVYWHGLDLHATRTTFHHDLMDAKTPGYIRRALMGHEPLDEGERSYAQGGISLKPLLESISEVPFDPTKVVSPIRGGSKSVAKKKAERLGLRAV